MSEPKRNELDFLVVDNTPEQLDDWCRVVERVTGVRPRTAQSPEAAREALESGPVHVLVVDLFLTPQSEKLAELDESEGLRLITACREQYPRSRIVAITSRLGETAKAGAAVLLAGADDFISTAWPRVYAESLLEQKLRIFRALLQNCR